MWAVAFISTVIAAILLIGAITSLYFVTNPGAKLGMISGFTILFAIGVGLLTNAKRSEIFAATAAYAAVLVVFVSGNLGNTNTAPKTPWISSPNYFGRLTIKVEVFQSLYINESSNRSTGSSCIWWYSIYYSIYTQNSAFAV